MKIVLVASLCAGIAAVSPAVRAQEQPQVAFEVATVRSVQPGGPDGVSLGQRVQGQELRIGAYTLRDCLVLAYRVRPYQVAGPDWIGEDRFDVVAKLPTGAPVSRVPEMLQKLLSDRFALKIRRENRQLPVHALLVGRPPLRLTENDGGDPPPQPQQLTNLVVTINTDGLVANLGSGSSYSFTPKGRFEARKLTMPLLAAILERFSDRAVLDMTGLTSAYNFSMDVGEENYTPVMLRVSVNAGVPVGPQGRALIERAGNPLVDAIEQGGLRTDSRRAPIEVLVVDGARRTPTDN